MKKCLSYICAPTEAAALNHCNRTNLSGNSPASKPRPINVGLLQSAAATYPSVLHPITPLTQRSLRHRHASTSPLEPAATRPLSATSPTAAACASMCLHPHRHTDLTTCRILQLHNLLDGLPADRALAGRPRKQQVCAAPAVAAMAALHEHAAGMVVIADRAEPIICVPTGARQPQRCCCWCCCICRCLAAIYVVDRLFASCCSCLYCDICVCLLLLLLLLVHRGVCTSSRHCSSAGCCRGCLLAWPQLHRHAHCTVFIASLRWQIWPWTALQGNRSTAVSITSAAAR